MSLSIKDSDFSGVVLIDNLTKRVTTLEGDSRETAKIMSSLEAVTNSINDTLVEIKGDLKDVKVDVGLLRTSHEEMKTDYNLRLQKLEEVEQNRKERRRSIIKYVAGGATTFIVAFLSYLLGLK